MPNIFNIPSSYHFFDSFNIWLEDNFGEQIGDVKIFFPNRRACREFQNSFINHHGVSRALPKFKAVADISYADFLDSFPKSEINHILDELFKIKRLEGFDHLFFLSNEIIKTKVFGENIAFTQALSIAMQLKNLFDDIERQEINIDSLFKIDDSDLAMHRQFTLEFLQKFYLRVRNSVLKNNVFSQVSYQNFIINKLAETVATQGLKAPLIIAGSTGSVNYSKKLIKAIATAKNGHVVLYGLNQNAEDIADETHPQFMLDNLLKTLDFAKNNVQKIIFEDCKICAKSRLYFLSYLMLPSSETHRWQGLENNINLPEIADDLAQNFSYLVAKNEIEEARIIAVAAAEGILNNKKIAIISTDQKFIQLLKIELEKFLLEFNDARSLDISSSKLVNLILLLLELKENNFESATLLALLKHSYSFYSDQNLIRFEREILRKQRSEAGLEGICKKLKSQDEELQNFFTNFLQDVSKLMNIDGEVDVSFYLQTIIEVIENFTKKTLADLIALEGAAEELLRLFEKLKASHNFIINVKDSTQFFQQLFSQISYFESSEKIEAIQILSPIEARLLNFDLLIVSSLNQGDFPRVEGENWLGRKIRSDLGIDLANKKYGQNSYDFCNYLSNKSVILTRSQTKSGVPTIASPFILRFEILCKKFAIKTQDAAKYYALLNQLESVQIKALKDVVSPKPKREFRPKKLAITDIAKLISDPYKIYAKKILQLQELEKIDYEPEYKEFGTFVHKALEEFVKNPESLEIFLQKAQNIFSKYFLSEESKLIWWPKFENIFKNFFNENEELKASRDYVEVPVKILIKDVLITGKIDRISFFENDEVEIFDYKTGQILSLKDVASGLQPQLTISALMLCLGMLENRDLKNITAEKIRALNYWKLSALSESEIKSAAKSRDEIEIMISAAKAGLERLVDYFNDEENGYFSAINSKSEYSHLARIF